MRGRWELSDAQWELIEPMLRPKRRADGRGRPWQDTRAVLNGTLWVLGTGAQWRELPKRYPPYQTCHRRLQQWAGKANWNASCASWCRSCMSCGNWNWRRLLLTPPSRGQKRGVVQLGPPSAAKGRKSSFSPMLTVFLSLLVSKAL